LTIAGLDPSGGAGIIADIKTFEAFGCFATAAISSVTFQNTTGVFGALHSTAESVRGQVEPVVSDLTVSAVKTGMLPTHDVIEETARLVRDNGLSNLVVDPVVRSTSGYDLIDNAALRSLIELLFPLADVITPNIPETERISGVAIESPEDVSSAARLMRQMGAKNVLIKGGHFASGELTANSGKSKKNPRMATDYLFIGEDLTRIEGQYHETTATHGTGCVLSAAIAANLANGKTLLEAVTISKQFVNEAIRTAPNLGSGHPPINIKPI
jgi:hydroxymethylpyrimidine kinase/phosphomethylpyrimidine kinase